jgi:hypothetical protein
VHGLYLFGKDTSAFVRCGYSEQPGLMTGQLRPIGRFLGAWVAKHPAMPTRALEIEAWARLRPVSDNIQGSKRYPRVWQVDSVTAVRENPTRRCGQ